MQQTDLIGTWRLLSYQSRTVDGSVNYPLGRDAVGYIIYTHDGHMAVSMMATGRPPYADGDIMGGTVEEKAAAAENYVSYCGRYEVKGDSVFHDIEVAFFPNRIGTSQRRFFEFSEDRLVLTTPTMLISGEEQTGHIVWERAD